MCRYAAIVCCYCMCAGSTRGVPRIRTHKDTYVSLYKCPSICVLIYVSFYMCPYICVLIRACVRAQAAREVYRAALQRLTELYFDVELPGLCVAYASVCVPLCVAYASVC